MSNIKNQCPEFPYFGARYPDATCIDGILHDLDKCDDNGDLYEPSEMIPCPFCQTEAHIDYFEPLLEPGEGVSDEDIANNERTRENIRRGIEIMKIKYGYTKTS